MSNKRILITGGAGFIGYHLARQLLLNSESELILVDNLSRGVMDNEFRSLIGDDRVEFINSDMTLSSTFESLEPGFDEIYHLAAVNGTQAFYDVPHEVLRVNILALLNLLEWAKDNSPNSKLLFTSSNEAYASNLIAFNQLQVPTPEEVPLSISDPYNPRWSYGGSKLLGELLLINYARAFGLKSLIVRPHNFFGPRSGYGHVIPQFIRRIYNREDPFKIYGATNTRSFCYIEDAVCCMANLMSRTGVCSDTKPPIVHIGSGEEISIETLATKLFAIAGWKPASTRIEEAPEGSVERRCPDITRLRRYLPEYSVSELDIGLGSTFEWYLRDLSE